jgi:hypothetical protein
VDAGMPKKFARRVDVCPGCQRHGGKGVAARTLNLSYAFGPIRASLIDGAKLRQLHCGFRIFVRLFLKNCNIMAIINPKLFIYRALSE